VNPCTAWDVNPCGAGRCSAVRSAATGTYTSTCSCPLSQPSYKLPQMPAFQTCFNEFPICRLNSTDTCAPGVCLESYDASSLCLCPPAFFPLDYSNPLKQPCNQAMRTHFWQAMRTHFWQAMRTHFWQAMRTHFWQAMRTHFWQAMRTHFWQAMRTHFWQAMRTHFWQAMRTHFWQAMRTHFWQAMRTHFWQAMRTHFWQAMRTHFWQTMRTHFWQAMRTHFWQAMRTHFWQAMRTHFWQAMRTHFWQAMRTHFWQAMRTHFWQAMRTHFWQAMRTHLFRSTLPRLLLLLSPHPPCTHDIGRTPLPSHTLHYYGTLNPCFTVPFLSHSTLCFPLFPPLPHLSPCPLSPFPPLPRSPLSLLPLLSPHSPLPTLCPPVSKSATRVSFFPAPPGLTCPLLLDIFDLSPQELLKSNQSVPDTFSGVALFALFGQPCQQALALCGGHGPSPPKPLWWAWPLTTKASVVGMAPHHQSLCGGHGPSPPKPLSPPLHLALPTPTSPPHPLPSLHLFPHSPLPLSPTPPSSPTHSMQRICVRHNPDVPTPPVAACMVHHFFDPETHTCQQLSRLGYGFSLMSYSKLFLANPALYCDQLLPGAAGWDDSVLDSVSGPEFHVALKVTLESAQKSPQCSWVG
ncbi:unnamed protein product, partial [Closterium sp. NIES-65]